MWQEVNGRVSRSGLFSRDLVPGIIVNTTALAYTINTIIFSTVFAVTDTNINYADPQVLALIL